MTTSFLRDKATHQVAGRVVEGLGGILSGSEGAPLTAYEIHMGVTTGEGPVSPFVIETRSGQDVTLPDGALDEEGLTLGAYLHGLFHNRQLRRAMLLWLASRKGCPCPTPRERSIRTRSTTSWPRSSGAPGHGAGV